MLEPRVYVGVDHPVKLYNPTDCIRSREGKYYLKEDKFVEPRKILDMNNPLSSRSKDVQYCGTSGAINIFASNHYGKAFTYNNIYNPINWKDYDMIIVSSIYAQAAGCDYNWSDINTRNFLDRLFIPIPVYTVVPYGNSQSSERIKVGSVGMDKAYKYAFTPYEYAEMIARGWGEWFSISALQYCLEYYKHSLSNQEVNIISACKVIEDYLVKKENQINQYQNSQYQNILYV